MADACIQIDDVIDFTGKSFLQKREFVYCVIIKCRNFDPSETTCDWSTKTMPLHVSNSIVISFVNSLNFELI